MRKQQPQKFTALFFAAVFCLLQVHAQDKIFKGKVMSLKDNQPVAGATISLKNTNQNTVANQYGDFTVTLKQNTAVIIISAIGYIEKELAIKLGEELTIKLEDDSKQLSAVVVTALGAVKKTRSLTFAVQPVKVKELLEIRDPDIINTLDGKIVGAVIQQGSGGLGSSTSVVLRGSRSIAGSSDALVVVDGIPVDNFNFSSVGSDFGNGFTGVNGTTTINPDDIESVNVLRGASSAALYGSAASNGVIVMTTKKGKPGKMAVDFNSSTSVQSVWALPQFQNLYGQGIAGVLNADVGESWGPKMEGQAYTNHLGNAAVYNAQPNNVKDFFENAISFNNTVGISSGGPKTQTYFSYSNSTGKGMIPLNKLNKHTLNLRVTNQITDRLSLDAKVTYVDQKVYQTPVAGENNAPIFNMYQVPRSMPIDVVKSFQALSTSTGIEEPTRWPSTLNAIYQNPYWSLYGIDNAQNTTALTTLVSVKYILTPWLNVQGRANIIKTENSIESKVKDGVLLYAPNGSNYSVQKNTGTSQWYDFTFSGSKKIKSNYKIDYQAGAIFNDYTSTGLYGSASALVIPNNFILGLGTNRSVGNGFYQSRSNAVFAQATVSYKDKLYIDASLRNDWNSTLPSNSRSFPYGSFGLAAIISDWFKLPAFISFFKINASYAQVGAGTGAYQTTTNYFPGSFASFGGVGTLQRSTQLALEDLKPELTKSKEASIDIRFFQDRLGIEATIYQTNTTNQILSIPLPPATGFTSQVINAGNMQNNGFELVVSATPVISKHFKWDISLNYAKNINKVVKLTDLVTSSGSVGRMSGVKLIEGEPLGQVYVNGWEKNKFGNGLVDVNGLPVLTTNGMFLGNLNPKAVMGFTNSFTYKDFSLRVLLTGRFGGVGVSGNEANLAFSGITKATEDFRDGGLVLNGINPLDQENTTSISAEKFWTHVSGKRSAAGEFFAYDATNIRVRELAFAYSIPVKSSRIKTCRVSVFANNICWLYRGNSLLEIGGVKRKLPFDPNMTLSGSSSGSDYGVFPASRNYGLNFQLSF